MRGQIKLVVPRISPTNGELLRMHWRDQRKLSKLWSEEIMVAKCEQVSDPPKLLKELRQVSIISYRRKLIKDDDNLHGGLKPVLDGLVENQLIFDDSMEYCKTFIYQIQESLDQRTVIIITAINAN